MQYDRVFPVAMPGELHIPPFCALQRMEAEIPDAVHIGGYLRGCAKTEVALRDELSLSLRPRRQSSRLPTGHMPKAPVLPCLRRSTLSVA
jgi:hypothetical protein